MFRNILSIGLALFIMAAGYPAVRQDRFAHNPGPDLRDSIRAVASFTHTAETPDKFQAGFSHALSTLNEAAGLTQVISSQGDGVFHSAQALDFVFLPALTARPSQDGGMTPFAEQALAFENQTPAPPLRPPRAWFIFLC
ncbi:MAG: hypothetical protein JEZ02_02885 [Desulfatibacillum sp.]|nr:hypothetical protein [Desulfatibacillum sp.]